jgi:hypothetical protein
VVHLGYLPTDDFGKGSPNGQAAGYFLAQHKHRFGKSKTVDKVTVFRPDKGIMPYLLFWVIDAPDAGTSEGGTGMVEDGEAGDASTSRKQRKSDIGVEVWNKTYVVEDKVLKRDGRWRNVLREHVFHARL